MQLDYKPEDFAKMLFPLQDSDNVLADFPKLKSYPEFGHDINEVDKVIKYVGLAYDKGSPLQKIDNIVHRKVTAAMIAGFANTDDPYIQDIMKCRNVIVNLMIIRYCRLMRSRTYMVIVTGNEILNDTMEQLMNFEIKKKNLLENSETKLALFEKAKKTAKDNDALSFEFLSNDDNKNLHDTLYTIADMDEEEYINLTPEDYSKIFWLDEHLKIAADAE